jgi:hypothetical protein
MLDLRVTEPSNSLVRSDLRELEGVPDNSEFGGVGGLQDLILADTGIDRGGLDAAALDRSEGSSRASSGGEGDESSELHGQI